METLFTRFDNLSFRYKLLLAFAVVSLVPLVGIAALSLVTARLSIQDKVGIYSTQYLDQATWNFDVQLMDVEKVSSMVLLDNTVMTDLNDYQEANAIKKRVISTRIRDRLLVLTLTNSLIKQVYISMPGEPLIRTGTEQLASTENYFGTAAFWESDLYQEVIGELGQAVWKVGVNDSYGEIYLMRRLAGRTLDEDRGVLIFVVDATLVRTLQAGGTLGDGASLYVVDKDLRVISHGDHEQLGKSVADRYTLEDLATGSAGYFTANGNLVIHDFTATGGWYTILEIPTQSLVRDMDDVAFWILLVGVLFAFLVLVVSLFISKRYAQSIQELVSSATMITDGNLDAPILVKQKDEIGVLAQHFSRMREAVREKIVDLQTLNDELDLRVEERTSELAQANREITYLNERLQAENLRMEAELDVTRRLQQMLLPSDIELQAIEKLDVVGYMKPAEEVGGDYYDVLFEDGRVKIGIGDVTGHGLESGVVMLMLQTAIRTLLISGETDPVRFWNILNRTLYKNIQRMRVDRCLFATVMDYNEGQLYLSGQHEQVIVLRVNGSLEVINTIDLGIPVGFIPEITGFINGVLVKLEPGDVVILYTDGVVEAENVKGEFYGLERLCTVVRRCTGMASRQILDTIVGDVHQFIAAASYLDDIAVVVLKQR